MFVCISKGNEVLKDIVAVELQGFVWLSIYHFMSLNVSSLHVFIFIEPFSTPSTVSKHLTHVLCKKKQLFMSFLCVLTKKINDFVSTEGDIGCSHYYPDDLAVGDKCFIGTTACSPHTTHLWERAEWFICIIKPFLSLFDGIGPKDGRLYYNTKTKLLWIVIQSLNLL